MSVARFTGLLAAVLMLVAFGALAQGPRTAPFPNHMVLSYEVYYGPIPV